MKALTSEGREPIISGITIVGNQKEGKKLSNNEQTVPPAVIEIKSMALFKDGKLTYWLHGHEGRGVSWIQNKMKSTIININCKDQKDAVGIEVVRSKTEIKVDIRAKRPMFHILIREEGDISEVKCPIDTSKEEEVKKLETEWANETRKEVMQALYAAQRTKSDVFGFGDAVNRAHPRAWESMKNDWNETFADSKADVKVDAFIRRTGMRTKSFLMEQSKQE
ncbi:Ger(x)C family spore germination protein [Paenibacillus darwinianus]|uniref:Ger(x)C family spore germination protein n=1 Tax=Paenibacillus darwinianus TaxID=1380763 RepID=UPI001CBAC044|nr:Ger(x)C family spore germination C-terminal domain-containing protein [Paenibacillus darwinianus]